MSKLIQNCPLATLPVKDANFSRPTLRPWRLWQGCRHSWRPRANWRPGARVSLVTYPARRAKSLETADPGLPTINAAVRHRGPRGDRVADDDTTSERVAKTQELNQDGAGLNSAGGVRPDAGSLNGDKPAVIAR